MMKYCPQCKADLVTQFLDGVERRVCVSSKCDFVMWDNPVPVVAGLVTYQDKLLLARNSAWPDGAFSMITGYLEKHETPEEAIIRETEEELGLVVTSLEFLGHYSFEMKNQLVIGFSLTAAGVIHLNHEIAEVELLDKVQVRQKDFGRFAITAAIVKDWLTLFKLE